MELKGLKQKCVKLKSGKYALYISHIHAGAIATYHGDTEIECYENLQNDALNLAQIWLEIHKPTPARTTLDGMFQLWLTSKPAFDPIIAGQPLKKGQYSQSTQKEWRKVADKIRAEIGYWNRRDLEKPTATANIIDFRDKFSKTARPADYCIQVLSACLKWARLRGLISHNPCEGIPKLYESDRSGIVWEAHEIEALCRYAEKSASRAFLFLFLTGLRRGDAISITWSNIEGNFLIRKTSKSRAKRTANILITPELRQLIDTCPKIATTILTNSKGAPWDGNALSQAFNRAKTKANLNNGKRIHDMRGTSATDKVIEKILQSEDFKQAFGWTEKGTTAPRKYVAIENVLKTRFGE